MTAVAAPWRDEQLKNHFQQVHALLSHHENLWRPQAFQHPVLPWEEQLPALAGKLRSLNFAAAEHIAESDSALIELLHEDLPELAALYSDLILPAIGGGELPKLSEAPGVPGRKWRQIKAFAACVPQGDTMLLEWCAGKAHLGRLLARLQQRGVLALEWDEKLVAAGAALARRERQSLEFHCIDVLDPGAAAIMQREHDVVALHACGQLHIQLLHSCVEKQPRTLTLAPCCYQLIDTGHYLPLSQVAKSCDLQLSLYDLHTAVRDNVTSPPRVREQRKTLQAWRLGFDVWQREVRGGVDYLPTPSLPLSVLGQGFADFCRELARRNNIAAPENFEYYEQAGWRRLNEVVALDLARIAFRRPLELWLVLDRALYLREHGYDVELGTFCARELTPRNILIRATRKESR